MKITASLAPLFVAAMAVSLAACQQTNAPEPGETETTQTAPDAKPGISGSAGRLVLPVVAGRPAAAYFIVRNDGPGTATLVGVHVAGAGETQMHKTEGGSMTAVEKLEIAPATSLEFGPGGFHVMTFDPDTSLKPGGDTELTLTFSDGDKLSMPLQIETMGGGGEDMPGMQH